MQTEKKVRDYIKNVYSDLGEKAIVNSFSPFFFYEIPVPTALANKYSTIKPSKK